MKISETTNMIGKMDLGQTPMISGGWCMVHTRQWMLLDWYVILFANHICLQPVHLSDLFSCLF